MKLHLQELHSRTQALQILNFVFNPTQPNIATQIMSQKADYDYFINIFKRNQRHNNLFSATFKTFCSIFHFLQLQLSITLIIEAKTPPCFPFLSVDAFKPR